MLDVPRAMVCHQDEQGVVPNAGFLAFPDKVAQATVTVINGIHKQVFRVIAGELHLPGHGERLVAAHIERHVHEGFLGLADIFIQAFKHVFVMHPPLETVGYRFTRKIVLRHHALETHRHV